MRVYDSAYELMSEMGRDLWEMGIEVSPKTYQNKVIEGQDEYKTKEIICEQYCLTQLPDPEVLFAYTKSKEWAEAEFKERIHPKGVNPGTAWQLRREIWEQFLTPDNKFDYSYGERFNQTVVFNGQELTLIQAVAMQLANDPDTRKAILPVYGGYDDDDGDYYDINSLISQRDIDRMDGHARIPCSMYFDFLIRKNKLHICYHQRSSDFIVHFGNDVWLAWQLMLYMTQKVNSLRVDKVEIEPGYLYHTIDSLHVYKKDWVKIKSSIDKFIQ